MRRKVQTQETDVLICRENSEQRFGQDLNYLPDWKYHRSGATFRKNTRAWKR
jgi:hypothetical protein